MSDGDALVGCAGLLIGAGILAGIIGGAVVEFGTQTTATFTIKNLDDQSTGNSHKYLIFTTQGEVFENTDAWFHGKTDSSNLQNWFTPGDTYRCPVYGVRNTLISSYRDVLDGCVQVDALTGKVLSTP